MSKVVPPSLREKILRMPEYRQGVHKVRVTLRNGERFTSVFVVWGTELVKLANGNVIPFEAEDIVEVENDL